MDVRAESGIKVRDEEHEALCRWRQGSPGDCGRGVGAAAGELRGNVFALAKVWTLDGQGHRHSIVDGVLFAARWAKDDEGDESKTGQSVVALSRSVEA